MMYTHSFLNGMDENGTQRLSSERFEIFFVGGQELDERVASAADF